jgi:tetraacyldisaccharide 4'-kinase
MRSLLRPAGWLYGTVVRIRNFLFDHGILPSERFNLPVISVGNLVTGGTGKSPHVLMLIDLLKSRYNLAVLSRGYGRSTKGFRIVSADDTARQSGDEPLQYKFYHPEITVAVCENRVTGIKNLLSIQNPPEVILLDDAFQHRYVKPGFNILLTEYDRLFTEDHLLPEGNLREARGGASRADLIIVTKSPAESDSSRRHNIQDKIREFSPAKVMFSYMRYRDPVKFDGNGSVVLDPAVPVFLLTGIANPEKLKSYILSKTKKVGQLSFRDHYQFTLRDIESLRRKFDRFAGENPGAILITTRKDAMRLQKDELLTHLRTLPLFVIDMEAVIAEEFTLFQKILIDYVESNS